MTTQFGRYELVAEIGRGGMAQLFLGRLVGIAGFAKPLAIKRILPHLSEDKRFVEMFLNEGRIAAKLAHPNICQVFEMGEVEGELFLAMEYLEGVPWGQLIQTTVANGSVRDPVAILRLAASAIGQACDGLHYAHELRDSQGRSTPVVHRDISPGNLFITVDGSCKVLDFGVSKIATEQHETRSGLIKGKLAYMPPEQLKGEDIDARVDVFAMAVVLWESLSGKRLFLRANDFQIHQAILEEPIPTLGHLFPRELGAQVDALLARGLERDRNRRYRTIRALADDLRALVAPLGGVPPTNEVGNLVRDTFAGLLAERQHTIARLTGEDEPEDTGSDHTRVDRPARATDPSITRSVLVRSDSVAIEREPARPRRKRGAILAAAILSLVVLGIVVTVLTRDDHDDGPPVQAASGAADAATPVVPDDAPATLAIETPDAGALDVATDDIVIDPSVAAGSNRPRPTPRPRPQESKPVDTRAGQYSVDSVPYATIYIDGARIDETPIYRYAIAPGRHSVRAVLANGRSKTFTIKIEPGKEVTSRTLRW